MAFDDTFKEQLKDRVDLAAIIGERITVQKKGTRYLALCPFHNDHHPSMNIDPNRGFFKCFACGKGGDVFTFLMDYDHLSFPESVKYLAERYGIPLPEDHERAFKRADETLPLKDMNAFAATVFHEYLLRHKDGHPGRAYLKSRGIGKEVALRYRLGYAPPEFRFMERFIRAKGFDPKYFQESGLFYFKDGRPLDFFRGRLMFPITNERGEVLGFGGRVLGQGEPKYLNTSETPLFKKKTVLYGLHTALKELAHSKTVYVTEGYLDVIACQEAGLAAVAPLGTALTEEQLLKLKRYGETIVLLFDGDGAGMRAAERASLICIELAVKAEVVLLPDGQDPFEFAAEHGNEALKQFAQEKRVDVYSFLLDRRIPKHPLSPADKSALAKDFAALLVRIRDGAVMADYKNRIAAALGLDASHFDHMAKAPPMREKPKPVYENARLTKVERDFVLMLCDNPRHIARAATLIRPEHLTDKGAGFIYTKLLEVRHKADLSFTDILELFPQPEIRDYLERKILGSDLFQSFRVPAVEEKDAKKAEAQRLDIEKSINQAVDEYLCKLKLEILGRQKSEVQGRLSDAMGAGNDGEVNALQEEFLRLAGEMQHLKNHRE
ncbi:MAG: DNA primase [Spirochaetes bacterium]|nr:DNA primase [Spirochaetota bacterium]